MRVLVIDGPDPDSIVTLAEAKVHLKRRDTDEDALIASYIKAAIGHIDGPRGWLGRAIGVQTLELRMNSFACTGIQLPYPEIIDVESVVYVDSAGAEQTMDADAYELTGSFLSPAWGTSWPSARGQREAVRIQYDAGYEDGVPDAIKAAVLLMVGDLHKQRETFVTGTISAAVPMSTTVEALLQPFRVYA